LARAASIRAADSAAKLVSTIGAAPPAPAITGGFFFAFVVAFFAPADLVVILLTFGFVVFGFVVLGFAVFAALADFVVDLVVAFFTAGFPVPLLLAFAI
jgi:hypothetical protein